MVLEKAKAREDQFDRSREKWNITKSPGGRKDPMYNKMKES
jgi:hypothetical protein